MSKTVVLLRGGIDSTICLAKAVKDHGKENVTALNLFYGQNAKKELDAAKKIAEHYGVNYIPMDISKIMEFSNSGMLNDNSIKPGEEIFEEQTDVPFRNGLMISVASAVSISVGADSVQFATHKDESAGLQYPDCKPEFFQAMANAISVGTNGSLNLELPFANMSKIDVMRLGEELGVPFELTWSCYVSDDEPCGFCVGCTGRARAFEALGIDDPLLKK
jgi:7-cyano-7-deazaguanine synthase